MKWLLGGLAVLLVVALALWIAPLGLVVARAAPELTAAEMTGSVWQGHLRDAAWRGTRLGDLDVAVDPHELLGGRLRIDFVRGGTGITGRLGIDEGLTLLERLNGQVAVDLPFAFAKTVDIGLHNAAMTIDGAGRCVTAGGEVGTILTGLPLIGVSPELRCTARCDEGWLRLPLASSDGWIGLDLKVAADRRYEAIVSIGETGSIARLALAAAGFDVTRERSTMAVAGRL